MVLTLALAAAAALPAQTLGDRMNATRERVLAKNGIEINGKIDAEYFNSSAAGAAVIDTLYSYETTQFTSFDLDMRYRPYEFVGARALLRFHQDWQTFFATRSRILGARWLSLDGNIANRLGFNAGDFRQKYSPLTLWSPELDLLHEPEIFSAARSRLMNEQFLGNNDRLLQGLNLNFASRFNLPLTEIRADALGARISKAEFLDSNGWQAQVFIPDNNGDGRRNALRLNTSDMDRFLAAGNAEVLLWDKVVLGGTYLGLMDDRESFQLVPYGPVVRSIDPAIRDNLGLNGRDSVIARDMAVASGRGGIDIAGFLGSPALTLELLGEYAQSTESNRFAWHFRRDANNNLVTSDSTLPGKNGKALNAQFQAGYSVNAFGLTLAADYLQNEASFSNPLAQSPNFVATRVMNTENDFASGTLYSTFDALNNGVFKFTPSRATEFYQQAPFTKSSYQKGIMTTENLARFSGDPVVQLLLPFGLATPNRSGLKGRLSGHWAQSLHATVEIASMKELEGLPVDSLIAPEATFTQLGGGLRLEAGKMLGWDFPLEFSGSFVRTRRERGSTAADLAAPEISADLLMAGFTWRFFRKWGLLGGYQQAGLTAPIRLLDKINPADTTAAAPRAVFQYDLTETQRHFRLGLEYALNRHAYLLVSGGLLQVERKREDRGSQAGHAADPLRNADADFTQALSQALIQVRF